MAKQRKFEGRQDAERREGYSTVTTGLPESRVQDEKQVLSPDQLGVTSASVQTQSDPTTMAAKKLKSKMSVRPEVSVEVLDGKQIGGVPLASSQVTRSVAGGSSVSAADDTSTIPYTEGKYRPTTRYGKKRSQELFEMDNTISEQIEIGVEDSKDLREDPESLQGYNGRKQFKQARGKKNAVCAIGTTEGGATIDRVPQQLLMDASLDFIHTKKEVFTSGQMIKTQVSGKAGYPDNSAKRVYPSTMNGVSSSAPASTPPTMTKANYTPTAFCFTVGSDGKIANPHFMEQCHIVSADPVSRDQANMNGRLDEINVTHSIIKMQTELGRETTDKWSPLGYVVDQPYELNMLMHDIEATAGAMMAAAYRSAVSSLAYQKNILSKDGIGPQAAAVRMILEGYLGRLASSTADATPDTDFSHVIWSQDEYRNGSPAAIIAMFDSVRKYQTKADLMGMQRSFGLHLSQVDNNINPFHVKKEFIKALDKAHMFSTLTGEYNPMLPIFVTDEVQLTHPLSLNFFTQNWVHPSKLEATLKVWFPDEEDEDHLSARDAVRARYNATSGTYAAYVYDYRDIRDVYHTNVSNPIVDGLLAWMLAHEGAIASTFGTGDVVIPITCNLTAPSLWNFMLCSASEHIALARNVVFRDILFVGDQAQYVWDDLADLKTVDPLYASQLKINGYTEALTLGKLAPDTAIRELWAEHFTLLDYDGDKAQYLAPWYFNERSYGDGTGRYTANEGFFNEETAFNMTMPSIRDGVRHEYVDLVKSMTERDVRLSLDRMVTIPGFTAHGGTTENPVHFALDNATAHSDNITLSACRYDINSDGRVVITVNTTAGDNNRDWDMHSFRCTPRELGWIAPWYGQVSALKGYTVVTYGDRNDKYKLQPDKATSAGRMKLTSTGTYGYVFDGTAAVRLKAYRVYADAVTAHSIDRSAALTQVFYTFHANKNMDTVNSVFVQETGIIPCFAFNQNAFMQLVPFFNLNSKNAPTSGKLVNAKVSSFAPVLWSVMQRICFPINRFENCLDFSVENPAVDPMEQAFIFGVCGTLASDFTQDVLERLDRYDQLGIGYTEDVFMSASPIFK